MFKSFTGVLRAYQRVGTQQALMRPTPGFKQLSPLANVSAKLQEDQTSLNGTLTRLQSPRVLDRYLSPYPDQYVFSLSQSVLQVR